MLRRDKAIVLFHVGCRPVCVVWINSCGSFGAEVVAFFLIKPAAVLGIVWPLNVIYASLMCVPCYVAFMCVW